MGHFFWFCLNRIILWKHAEMKTRFVCLLITMYLSTALFSPAAAQEENAARQVLAEINLARTEPLQFAVFLHELRGRFQGKDYRIPGTATLMETSEGVDAVDEAIQSLSRQKPQPPLAWSAGLAAAAADLAKEQAGSGATGHGGFWRSGMRKRIERHGTWVGRIGENIVYNSIEPRSMVMQLIIDDGVPGRGHRKNLFNPAFGRAGVACGPHPRFDGMCVIDFSGRFSEGVHEE